MPSATFKTQRKQLEAERQELLHELEHIRERTGRRDKAEQGAGETRHDDHMGELAAEHYEREKDLLKEANVKRLLELIDKALAKIEAGSYGICDTCNGKISKERLKALPSAALCIDCQTLAES